MNIHTYISTLVMPLPMSPFPLLGTCTAKVKRGAAEERKGSKEEAWKKPGCAVAGHRAARDI